VGWRRRRPKSGELAVHTGWGGGARGAPECGGLDLRCGEGGLTGVGLSVVARFGRRGMPVRESSGGYSGRLEVWEGAWRQWEAHRHRGWLGRWLVNAVVDEVVVEEVAGGVGGGLALRADMKEEAVL
jgi:hypothetical protein